MKHPKAPPPDPPRLDMLLFEAANDPDDPLLRAAVKGYWQASRARKAGAAVIEVFCFDEIYTRDDWVCGICGEAIDRDVPAGWKRAGSIDHIIPLSRGGNHTRDNVQAAHISCNSKKGNLLPEEMP